MAPLSWAETLSTRRRRPVTLDERLSGSASRRSDMAAAVDVLMAWGACPATSKAAGYLSSVQVVVTTTTAAKRMTMLQ